MKKIFGLHIYQADESKVTADVKLNNIKEMEWRLTNSLQIKAKYIIKIEGNTWLESGFRACSGIIFDQQAVIVAALTEYCPNTASQPKKILCTRNP